MAKKFSGKFWLALVIFSLTGQVAWVVENMYFNVFIYKMFHADPTAISTMVAASATAAAVTTLLIGALSDRVGKRKIFIVAGYILWGISILAFALIRVDVIGALFGNTVSAAALGVNLVILMDCVMTFFGSSANDACFNAWLTESTDEGTRGKAEGINSMMPLVAILVVFGGFMGFDLDKAESWTIIYIIIGAVVLLIGVAGIFLIEDTTVETGVNRNYFANIFYGFRPSVIKGNGVLYMTLIAFMIFGISIQTYMPYLILYYTVSLKMENYVMIMAPAIILASVATFFYGRLYDRFGFVKTVFPAVFILMGGYTLLYLFRDTPMVFLGSLLMMSGYLCGMAVFGAMVRDHTPENKTGMFQGLRIFAQVLIPGITGPYIGAFVLSSAERVVNDDGTESFIPNENIYLAAFMVALLLMIFLYLVFLRRKETAAVKVVNDVQADSMEALLQSGQPAQDVEKMMTSVIDGIVPAAAGKQAAPAEAAAAPEGAGRQEEFWDVLRDAEAAERTAGQTYVDRRDADAWASGEPGDEASTEPVYYAESEGPADAGPERTAGQTYVDRRDADAWASGRPGDEVSTKPVHYAESEGSAAAGAALSGAAGADPVPAPYPVSEAFTEPAPVRAAPVPEAAAAAAVPRALPEDDFISDLSSLEEALVFEAVPEDYSDVVSEVEAALSGGIDAVSEDAEAAHYGASRAVGEAAEAVSDATDAFSERTEAVNNKVEESFDEASEAVSGVADAFPEGVDTVNNEVTETFAGASEAASGVADAFSEGVEAVNSEITETFTEASETFSEAADAFSEGVEAVNSGVTETFIEASETFSEAADAVSENIEAVRNETEQAASETAEALTETAEAAPVTGGKKGYAVLTRVSESTQENTGKVRLKRNGQD